MLDQTKCMINWTSGNTKTISVSVDDMSLGTEWDC